MPIIKFEGWFPRRESCFVISNTGISSAHILTMENFIKPPIKILNVINASSRNLGERFKASGFGDIREFRDELPLILRGQSKDWKLVNVDIDVDPGGIGLQYVTQNPELIARCESSIAIDGKIYGCNIVSVCRTNYPASEEFELNLEGVPATRYKMEIYMTYDGLGQSLPDGFTVVHVAKFIGSNKIYGLEMREDNHGKTGHGDRQYYVGELNL